MARRAGREGVAWRRTRLEWVGRVVVQWCVKSFEIWGVGLVIVRIYSREVEIRERRRVEG